MLKNLKEQADRRAGAPKGAATENGTNSSADGRAGGNGGSQDRRAGGSAGGSAGSQDKRAGGNPATVTSDVFACLLNFTGDTKVVKTSSPRQVRQVFADGIFYFYLDYDFQITDKAGKMQYKGTWKCDGDKDYIVNTDDGDEYSSKTLKWKGVTDNSSNNNSGGSGSTVVDTTLTDDELKGGKFVKIGMKGKIVGDIQRLLIKLGYTDISKSGNPDDIFGRRTKASVVEFQRNNQIKDDGAVGPETWPKLNDPAAVKKGASSSTSSSSAVSSSNGGETEPGSDIIIKESLKKTLRKNLLKFN